MTQAVPASSATTPSGSAQQPSAGQCSATPPGSANGTAANSQGTPNSSPIANVVSSVTTSVKKKIRSVTLYDVAVASISCSLYLPDQVSSVASKHLTVALDVPAATTALYSTKLYASKTMSNFFGSLLMLLVQLIMPKQTVALSIAATVLMLAARIVNSIVFFTPNAIIYYYFALIVQAFCQGMFQTTFYPMAADKMSTLSIAFKLSKIILWLLQISMDLIMPGRARGMVIVHLGIMTSISVLGCVTWIVHCIMYGLRSAPKVIQVSSTETAIEKTSKTKETKVDICPIEDENTGHRSRNSNSQSDPHMSSFKAVMLRLLGNRFHNNGSNKRCRNGCCSVEEGLSDKSDISMKDILKNAWSPMMMCLAGWPFRTFFQPGILPYTLVDRNLCHPIIITVMFFSFLVTFCVHLMKAKCQSLSRPWGPPPMGWHLLWLCVIPPILCVPFIYMVLHHPQGDIYHGLRNNVVNTIIITLVLNAFTTVLDNSGYIGVSANTKVEGGTRGANALRFIAINAFAAQFMASFVYRLSSGYLILRRKYIDDICNAAPTGDLSWLGRLGFWITQTFSHAWYDFIHEFDGNIRDFVK